MYNTIDCIEYINRTIKINLANHIGLHHHIHDKVLGGGARWGFRGLLRGGGLWAERCHEPWWGEVG